jgi:type VI secretion system secreted protein VgrG
MNSILGFSRPSLLTLTFALTFPLYAEVPIEFNYQGRIVDGTNLVNGTSTVLINLFDAETGGGQVYSETQSVGVVDGLYSLSVGASNSVPGSLSSALAVDPLYLELSFDGATLSPRTRIVSVPYAALSRHAESLDTGDRALYSDLARYFHPTHPIPAIPFNAMQVVDTNAGPVFLSASIGGDSFGVLGFSGRESLSRLFEFEVSLVTSNASIDIGTVIGDSCSIQFSRGGTTEFYGGVVESFAALGTRAGSALYRATVVPVVSLLRKSTDLKIFQGKSVPEILDDVFLDAGLTLPPATLTDPHPKFEYLVQYRETDFNFVSRLMEEEGIFYWFEHSSSTHEMRLADGNGGVHTVIPPAGYYGDELAPPVPGEEYLRTLDRQRNAVTGSFVLGDYDFVIPIVFSGTAADPGGIGEIYDFGLGFSNTTEATRQAGLLQGESQSRSRPVVGTSNIPGLRAGTKLQINDTTGSGFTDTYLITSVQHSAMAGGTAGTPRHYYANRFACIPDTVTFRPRRVTPKPVVQGPQTAVVVGPAGEEIYTDEYGRVKVQFHWDREGASDETSSVWMRVSQLWAGKDWGTFYLPRIGDEVIVDFLEGNPDHPLVIGSVYNQSNLPPYSVTSNRITSTGFKSKGTGGSASFNEIRFDDNAGEVQIVMHSDKVTMETLELKVDGAVRITTDAPVAAPVSAGERYRDNAIIAWARIDGTGLLGTEEFGVSSVNHFTQGEYSIVLDSTAASANLLIPVAVAEVSAQPFFPTDMRIASVQQVGPSEFKVYINDGTGNPADNPFTFMVTGR